jgi:hypothetical protein
VDTLGDWLAECMRTEPAQSESAADLYRSWCRHAKALADALRPFTRKLWQGRARGRRAKNVSDLSVSA